MQIHGNLDNIENAGIDTPRIFFLLTFTIHI